jgi:DNA-binding response OmpR family regulator
MQKPSSADEAFRFYAPTRVLVVDDDPLLCESARVYLTTLGAQVETAPDGKTAVDLLCRNTFDIVLADIEMPGLDGFGLVEWMRADEKLRGLPVIMLTVRGEGASIDRAYRLGANFYVTKPVNWGPFLHQLRRVLRASQSETEAQEPAVPDGWRTQKTAISGGY